MIPNYKEATLISGPLFNKTLKQLSGNEPTESQLNDYNDLINGTMPTFYRNSYPNYFPVDFNVYNYFGKF